MSFNRTYATDLEKVNLGSKCLKNKEVTKENVGKIRHHVVKMLKFQLPVNQKLK